MDLIKYRNKFLGENKSEAGACQEDGFRHPLKAAGFVDLILSVGKPPANEGEGCITTVTARKVFGPP